MTGHLQNFYYSITIRAGDPRPQPGSARHARHRQRIHVAVLLAYLGYTIYEAHWQVRKAGDFYQVLGVSHDADDKTLQSRFRRLSLLYHPDKITTEAERPAAEARYMLVNIARDTLIDPAKRFAYDRLGPDSLQWKQCITTRDFVRTGLSTTYPWYIGTVLVMTVMNYLGFLNWGTYWRYLATAALAAFELHTLTRPDFPTLIPKAVYAIAPKTSLLAGISPSPYLPFQTLQIARTAIVTLFIALSRLGPLLEQSGQPGGAVATSASEEEKLARQVQRLDQMVAMNGMEASRLVQLELVPFLAGTTDSTASPARQGNAAIEPGLAEVRDQVMEWLVTNTVRSDKQVRDAVVKVLDKRKHTTEAGEIVG